MTRKPVKDIAMVDLGLLNSRMKDFCDLAFLTREHAFDGISSVITGKIDVWNDRHSGESRNPG